MNLLASPGTVVSLVAGLLILRIPRLMDSIVAIHLIVMGLFGTLALGGSPMQ